MIVKVCKLEFIKTLDGLKKVGVDTIEPKLPTYGKEGDACMDIYPIYSEYDGERDRWIYHTGLAFAIGNSRILNNIEDLKDKTKLSYVDMPNEMELRPRSNLTKSDFYIPNAPCTLDWGYRGELLMVFKNRTSIHVRDSISLLATAVEKLAMRIGAHGEIKQYTSTVRKHVNKLSNSITEPPYKCDGKDRCCQLIIRGAERIQWEEVQTVEELGATERGKGGFGSTGGAVK
jgi:dUTPase